MTESVKNPAPEIKVIAIKLPSELQERILSFPFLHAISEFYPKADIHLITHKKEVEVLNLLPFKAYYSLYDEDEIKSVFDVHPYAANAAIYNVDLFISLTNSFADACLGLALRAKKRVGFSDNWKTLVLNRKTTRPIGHHFVEDLWNLYELATGERINTRLRVSSRPLQRIIEDETPYMAINLSPLRDAAIDDEWIELMNSFTDQKIIFFASDEQVKMKPLMTTFCNILSRQNTYELFYYRDWIELGRMLAYSAGVITYSGACAALSAYVGAKTIILYESEDPQKTGPFYFLSDVVVMGTNNPTLLHNTQSESVLKDRVKFKMDEVANKAYDLFPI